MKRRIIIGMISLLVGIVLAIKSYGQSDQAPGTAVWNADFVTNPNFIVTIIAGVLMALGFQFILTNLSLALGITSIGDIKKKTERMLKPESRFEREQREILEEREREEAKEKKHSKTSATTKFMSMAGGWSLITTAISLFLACMLAVKLTLIESNIIGFTMGLTIWAIFSMTMLYLESRAIGSLFGGIWRAAVGAVRSGVSGFGSLFSNKESQSERDSNIADTIRNEVYQFLEDPELNTKFDNVIEKVRPKFDTHQFRAELADLLNEIKIEQKEGISPEIKELYLKVAEKEPNFSRTDVRSLGGVFESVLSGVGLGGVSRQFGGLGNKASEYVQREYVPKIKEEYIPQFKEEYLPKIKDEMEHYVLEENPTNTNPEIVRAEIDEIFNHEIDVSKIKSQGSIFDKNDIATAVAEQKGVSRSEALDVANKLENALNSILRSSNIKEIASSKFQETKEDLKESFGSKKEELKENLGSKKEELKETLSSKRDEYMDKLEGRFRSLFRRINRPELDYELLKREFKFMVQNPKLAPKVLKMKLNQMDSDTLVGIMTASGFLNKTEMENVIKRFEETRAKTVDKLDEAEGLIRRKTREAEEFALEQAENTRRTAAEASWWLFAMLVVSGLAAGIGGMVGM